MKEIVMKMETDYDLFDITVEIQNRFKLNGRQKITIEDLEEGEKIRTPPQNSSLQVYCRSMASAMRDAGIDQRELTGRFKEGFTLPVTEHMIKQIIKTVMEALYGKKSTTELTTVEIQDLHKIVDKRFAEVTGISIPWPSRESQMMKEYEK